MTFDGLVQPFTPDATDGHVRRGQLFVNGKVFTGRGEDDFASAFRITDGTFSWVGDESELDPTEVATATDLLGRTVVPGLLDVHTHPAFMATLVNAVSCLPPEVDSLAGLLDRLRSHPSFGAGPEKWIEGFGYDESKYPEGRGPTADDLDQLSRTQPVFVQRCDGHSSVANRRALELAGITDDSPDPAGASFGRDSDGRLNGLLIETNATDRVAGARPQPGGAERARDLARLNDHFLERGIVAVGDLLGTMVPAPLRTFRTAETAGLRVQCALYYNWSAFGDDDIPDLTDAERTGRVKIAGLKLFMDGAYSNRTAWTEDPYPDSDDHGMHTLADDDLRAAVSWARRNQVQVAVHAMGDRALNHVIAMFADEQPWMGTLPSIRLEHATLFTPEMIARLNAARMTFAVISHSIFLFAEYDSYQRNLSEAQFEIAYPIKSFYQQLSFAALSSDNPATAWADADNVFVSIKAAVLRRAYNGADMGQAEAITVPQALLLYTGRARQVAPLDGVGLIETGYEGSFVILDRDVFSIPAADIDQVSVTETWIQGERAFAR
ncbi:MAG: amidohydrolase family protein [Nakamurella sp.]